MPLVRTSQPPSQTNLIPELADWPNAPASAVAVCDAPVAALASNGLVHGLVFTNTSYLFHVECTVVGATSGFFLLLDATALPTNNTTVTPLAVRGISSNGNWGFAEIDRRAKPVGPFANDVVVVFSVNTSPTTFTQAGSPTAFFTGQCSNG